MENPVRFWGLVAGVAVVTLGLSVLGSGVTLGRAVVDEAWAKLETAKTPGERVEIAREFPKTPAERWALLQAATEYYLQGFNDLPSNRDAALPNLKKALDLFEQVAREAPADSPQARAAAFGLARTYEARNEIDKAVSQYEKVAATKGWEGTEEARESARLAKSLKSGDAAAFYKELYAYKPPTATVPPGGIGDIPLPPNHPPLTGPTTPTTSSPFPPLIPGLGTGSATGTGTGAAAGKATGPDPLMVPPPPTPAPRPESKKEAGAGARPLELIAPEAPKAKNEAKPAAPSPGAGAEKSEHRKDGSGLPSDVFAPK